MIRFVKIIGVMFILGFMLWALLPGYNNIVEIANSTINMTSLELATVKLVLPVFIPALIIVFIIWHHFGRKSEGGGEE